MDRSQKRCAWIVKISLMLARASAVDMTGASSTGGSSIARLRPMVVAAIGSEILRWLSLP